MFSIAFRIVFRILFRVFQTVFRIDLKVFRGAVSFCCHAALTTGGPGRLYSNLVRQTLFIARRCLQIRGGENKLALVG